jgi:hypothetical protein
VEEPINPANELLQFEAVWVLTNIACGTSHHVQQLVDAGCINPVMNAMNFDVSDYKSLSKTRQDLLEQAVWMLANVTGDCPAMRNTMLGMGMLDDHLLRLVNVDCSLSLATILAFALSNVVRFKANCSQETRIKCMRGAETLLTKFPNNMSPDLTLDAVWTIDYACSNSDEGVMDAMVNSQIVNWLGSWLSQPSLMACAVRIVGSFTSSHDVHTEMMLTRGYAQQAFYQLSQTQANVQKEILWLLSNVTAGSQSQIDQVMALPNFVPQILSFVCDPSIKQTGFNKVAHEACWVIANLFEGGSDAHAAVLQQHNYLDVLANCLRLHSTDDKTNNIVTACFIGAMRHFPRDDIMNFIMSDSKLTAYYNSDVQQGEYYVQFQNMFDDYQEALGQGN